ncbi:metallophosphoesterase family protein [Kallipyga gabonensis]|uniref:metallophosphoesterase family protein n=1 Tax=Kallipyga gabonensis TaxID=1686287 RepID=UPI0006B548D1|nr:metallophosphoesterase [Kallipyga gabonensis]
MRIACIGDAHYSAMHWRTKALKEQNEFFYNKIFASLFAQEADLYLSLGDLTHYGSPREFRSVYKIINSHRRENQRFENLVGNHDLLVQTKASYQALTGSKLYWSEDYDDVKLIFMDTSRALHPGKSSSSISWEQAEFVKKELEEAGDKLALVFAHHPPERMTFRNEKGRVDKSLTLDQILKHKKGRGIVVNGHLHQDRFYTRGEWGFLQFNDLLDEPTVRCLDIKDGELTMSTISFTQHEMIHAARNIALALLTFRRVDNPWEYAQVRELLLSTPNNVPMTGWTMDYLSTLDSSHVGRH